VAISLDTERPASIEEAAELVRRLGEDHRAVRPRGGGTKLAWGAPGEPVAVELHTSGLDRIVEHNEGDLTAVLEAGVPLAAAQAAFAEAGQMLALDPPLGPGDAATIGGALATGDSGPLRHRYGSLRDLVVGVTVVLSDGTVARAGGKVIKNVAGYDLAKLFGGSHGTLGLIASVSVRLHPRPAATATAQGRAEEAGQLARAVAALARLPLEADCLDVRWDGGEGRVLVRFSGAAAEHQAAARAPRMEEAGLGDVVAGADDEDEWAAQRAAQRSADGAILKVAARPSDLAAAARAVDAAGARMVGRGALGLLWIALDADGLPARVAGLRDALHPHAVTLLDAPEAVRAAVDPWPAVDRGELAVMRRVKARFDPARIFRPGAFVGGI
jgi:glycolate oxidase FAD binding subunit